MEMLDQKMQGGTAGAAGGAGGGGELTQHPAPRHPAAVTVQFPPVLALPRGGRGSS